MDEIILENISKLYGRILALDNISLRIPLHSVVCIAGPNGSGKTTLLNIITKTIKPTKGNLKLPNLSIGYSYQNPHLCVDMTVKENIQFFLDIYGKGKDRGVEVVKITNLEKWMEFKVSELSSGAKKRVEVAIPLLSDPDIIVMDEPTTGLDADSSKQIIELIRKLRDKTIIVASHQLRDFEDVCDYLIVLINGRKVFESPVSQLNSSLEEAYMNSLQNNKLHKPNV